MARVDGLQILGEPTRREILRLVWEVEKRLDTVVTIGAGVRCNEHGDDTIVAPILERLGYNLERAKTNTGLGRRPAPAQDPAREMVTQ